MHKQSTRKLLAAAGFGALLCATSAGAYPQFDVSVDEAEAPIPAVEYYNAEHDQYFVTTSQDEMAVLDAGVIAGWARSGNAPGFLAFADAVRVRGMDAAHAGATPVCRFFIPPASHFLSASPDECAAVAAAHPEFTLESPAAFYAWAPRDDGTCPQLYTKIGGFEFQPVYRLWNKRPDTNHRFTASKAERDEMVDEGWVSEGAGDDGVAMCVPVWK
ncbi:MAG TPA: hypothetical protein VMN56_18005 [Casimicrobiaceae bacterium]|nr:hypothetical protein [Casimicrobiaceae bacterium]